MVTANRLDPNKCGNKFLPEIAKALPYFDMSWGFAIPFAHAALLGVVKSFWLLALFNYTCKEAERESYWIPKARRKLMAARAVMIRCTVEAGRPYRDIVATSGGWTMEDWLHWTETYSLYIARDILPPTMEAAWQALRKSVVHYARLDETTLSASEREAARDNLRAYAVFVDKYLPADECTLNLHTVVCHTYEQESQTGSIFEMSEYWIERLIGTLKKCVKYRMTTQPEKVIVGYYLLKRRLLQLSRFIKSVEYKEQTSHTIKDEESTEGGSFCLQSGQIMEVLGEVGEVERNATEASLERMSIDVFEIDNQSVVIKFKSAYLGGEIVQSKAYLLARERVSYCVSVDYHSKVWDREANEFRDQCQTRFGVVHYFVKIESSNVNEDRVFRLAKVTLYHSATPSIEGEVEVIDETKPFRSNTFVRLDDLRSKALFARDEKPYRRNKTYVLPFMTTRKL